LILLNTHGHFDHVANNDLILEAGFPETEFWLIETEKPVIDLLPHFEADLKEHEKYYDPHGFEPWIKGGDLYRGLNTMAAQAKIIPLSSRVTQKFGDVELQGWQVKRFFIVHDGAHTPGHVSFMILAIKSWRRGTSIWKSSLLSWTPPLNAVSW